MDKNKKIQRFQQSKEMENSSLKGNEMIGSTKWAVNKSGSTVPHFYWKKVGENDEFPREYRLFSGSMLQGCFEMEKKYFHFLHMKIHFLQQFKVVCVVHGQLLRRSV